MEKRIVKINSHAVDFPELPKMVIKKRVAAYARVSTSSEEQLNSIEAQKSYYENLIKSNPEWIFVGLYADEGISGLSSSKRVSFNQMIKDALNGSINLIITKSISRFARNTVDALTHIRKLKEKGVAIYFEKEDINTLDAKGEFMITLLTSMAQEEARSISENVKWGARKRMADGKYSVPYSCFLGYKKGTETFEIVPEEAEVVRLIYYLSICGDTTLNILKFLTKMNIPTPSGKEVWNPTTIDSILRNEKYCGNALLQKKYISDYLTKKEVKNRGELPQYFIENGHPPIIDIDVWNEVQARLNARVPISFITLSKKLYCSQCGNAYTRKIRHEWPYDKEPAIFYACASKYDKNRRCKKSIFYEQELDEMYETAILIMYDKYQNQVSEILKEVISYSLLSSDSELTSSILSTSSLSIKDNKLPRGSKEVLTSKVMVYPDNIISFEMLNGETITLKGRHWTPKRNQGKRNEISVLNDVI